MVPEINRKEWQDLIKGDIKYNIESFSLQMKISSLNRNLKNGFISMNQAVKELHDLCIKFERIYKNDLDKIFKN